MRKYNRIVLAVWAFGACESLEGERRLLPNARVSVFVPANWEAVPAEGAELQLQPRGVKTVRLRVVVDPKRGQTLAQLKEQEMRDIEGLAKQGLKVDDIALTDTKRGHLHGHRLLVRMTMKDQALRQLEDLLIVDSLGVGVIALGPADEFDKVSPEIERIMSSVRSLTPEPETPRTYPPDAVTSASQRVTTHAWK